MIIVVILDKSHIQLQAVDGLEVPLCLHSA